MTFQVIDSIDVFANLDGTDMELSGLWHKCLPSTIPMLPLAVVA